MDFVRPDAGPRPRTGWSWRRACTWWTTRARRTSRASRERGGTLAVGFHSGAVDENCHVRLGGYPGAFREALGVRTDELFPLLPGESVGLTATAPGPRPTCGRSGSAWRAPRRSRRTPTARWPASRPSPATATARGTAWYLATRPDPTTLAALLDRIREEAGVAPVRTTPPGVEAVLRRGADADYLFLIDHAGVGRQIEVAADASELLTGKGGRHERRLGDRAGGGRRCGGRPRTALTPIAIEQGRGSLGDRGPTHGSPSETLPGASLGRGAGRNTERFLLV